MYAVNVRDMVCRLPRLLYAPADLAFPIHRQRQHRVAARVTQRRHDGAGGIQRGETRDTAFDSGAANLEAVLNLDAFADGTAPASNRVDDEADGVVADAREDRCIALAYASHGFDGQPRLC